MKSLRILTCAAALVAALSGCATAYPADAQPAARAEAAAYGPHGSISISYFYDALSPYGDWVDYPSYGWCWVPRVSINWRPYSYGQWAYTDYGWTWLSSEPWGWATCHYGRWWFDPYYGWVWEPGDVWGPAWVAWRYGPEWVGWAPLPPESEWSASDGVRAEGVIQLQGWCFVRDRDLLDTNLRQHLEPRERNVRFIQRTRETTRYAVHDGTPVNQGVKVDLIERVTGRRIGKAPVAERHRPGRAQIERSGAVALFRPRVQAGRSHEPPRVESRRPARPADQRDIQQRARSVRQRLESSLATQRREMERRQAAELRRSGRDARSENVRRRHAEERQAFEKYAEHQRQELERRMKQSEKADHHDRGRRGRGNPHGRGNDRGHGR